MKADTLTLKALFQKDVRYVIAMFQRPYVWTQDGQWEALWDDLRNVAEWYLDELEAVDSNNALAEERARTHFMGALVLQQQPTDGGPRDTHGHRWPAAPHDHAVASRRGAGSDGGPWAP